jgi:tetraacyldisaccharide 4'-kinase
MLLRRYLLRLNLIKTKRLPVPVVVIGNLTVGGCGKTPLTKSIAQNLQAHGYKVGIILRGYKAQNTKARLISPEDSSAEVGDEALIYAQAGLAVAIAKKRVDAGHCLLARYPQLQLILADDGLQHYQLHRDLEICVIDSSRMFGNQHLLPLGPLREPISRLKQVDAIVINQSTSSAKTAATLKRFAVPIYFQHLQLLYFLNPSNGKKVTAKEFAGQKIQAMAGIGNPHRFFNFLEKNGILLIQKQAFPDHHNYQLQDLNLFNPEYAIITTEKDFTKLATFKQNNLWVAIVEVKLNQQQLYHSIINLIK